MTYGKKTSREYLDWLDRELTRLEHASKQDRDAAGDHASTSTMITWHAVERIYHDMPPAMKAALRHRPASRSEQWSSSRPTGAAKWKT
jgi:hypothetical protein